MQRPVRCLLVDDLEENLLALSALMRRENVEILTARSGAEALELLLAHDVALALVDVQMPEMDGFELAELMRGSERTRRVPIIFVTAAGREPYRMFKGYHAGAVDFLYKPIDPMMLESKAAVFFELYRYRQRLAEELKERTETLRLNEMFTAVLGHDLRNPLNAIVTSAYVLQQAATDAMVREAANRILSSGTRMNRMIEDILDLTRARLKGSIALSRTPEDLGVLLERVVQEHRTSYPKRMVDVALNGDMRGDWDAGRIQQVMSNLIGNALQHGDRDGRVRVTLDGTRRSAIVMTVGNDGAIADDKLPGLFDPFSGGQRRLGASEGLGLGLYIAQQIVLAHHGQIAVDSSAETGTTFRVTVPRSSLGT